MLRPALIRTLHTTSARPAGGFSRFNPWAKQSTVPPTSTESTTEQSKPEATFNVNHYAEEEESLLWRDRNVNQTVDEIQQTVQTIVTDNFSGVTESSWKDVRFDSADTKLKVIKESIKQTGKEVPNRELSNIQTGADLLAYFTKSQDLSSQTKASSVRSFFEDNADTLPSNLTFRH
ncbi:hypothetical protein BDB00DRAFT_853682 [Zychaea mexicana]|uniref:uncharacterized protein n=1 Tax=Zychaea mexicana TaxID=64656 RepID=UPI0022FEBAA1|nr:uncharacterized protein BDB00DRAFT_853682 [Zychaea mexicana]KAI9484769.1 hypothetical protein BDB00DRAFT_853682 [Zychaea mexicana]